MKQYYNLTISEYSNIPLKLKDIERELEKAKDEDKTLYIRIKSSAQLFELLIPPLNEYLKYYRRGTID